MQKWRRIWSYHNCTPLNEVESSTKLNEDGIVWMYACLLFHLSIFTHPDLHHVTGLLIMKDVHAWTQHYYCSHGCSISSLIAAQLGRDVSWDRISTEFIHGKHGSLTHWGRGEMNNISQTTFSNIFSSMKMFEFWLKFHWSLFPRAQWTKF